MPRKAGRGKSMVLITGVSEVDRALKLLPKNVQRKVVRQSMREGVKLLTKAAKRNAPVLSGDLKRAIKTRAGKARRGVIAVETRVGAGDFKGDQFYAAFVEYGTSHAPPHPFMLPAFVQAGPTARALTMSRLLAGVLHQVELVRAR
jgi:HK97 gp10 family phage protein